MNDLTTVQVSTPSHSYKVYVGSAFYDSIGNYLVPLMKATKICIVSDDHVYPLYGSCITQSLTNAGYRVSHIVIPHGEAHKNIQTLSFLLEELAAGELTRDDAILALGGGVVGDIAGLASAVYLRGIKLIHVPTSLLSMVDSSIGGKTAIDLKAGKNLAGTFTQPVGVFVDTSVLATLDQKLFCDSWGEILKYAVIADKNLWHLLATHNQVKLYDKERAQGTSQDLHQLGEIIKRCIEIKSSVVSKDETEGGLRQILNFGHTIGHAIEAAMNFEQGHGSCVAAGMCCIARAAYHENLCSAQTMNEIINLVSSYQLPTTTNIETDVLYHYATHDKKRHGNSINVVIPQEIGQVYIQRMSLDEFKAFLSYARA